ncbi:MAG: ABC transporter substrate-binding protein [Acidimicrobiia bacterium]|nr:ABC transporter substrate-binding protein [Acidimicrobiia bacterium]
MNKRLVICSVVTMLLLAACGGTPAGPGITGSDTTAGATVTTASGDTTSESTGDEGSDDPIVFAASLPLTGGFSIPGTLHQEAYQVCVDLINEGGGLLGREAELLVSDNQSDPETTASQTERFINVDDADILLGTFSTLLSFPSSAIAEQAQMVYPEPSDSSLQSHSRGFEYNFGFTLKPINYIGQTPVDVLAHYRDQGVIPEDEFPESAAVIYLDDFFTNSISQGLVGGTLEIPGSDDIVDFGEGYLNEVGIELVFEEQFPAEFTDWVGLANRVKNSGAEMLFALTLPPAELDIVRAMQTVDYQPSAAFFSQGTYREFQEQLGDAANGIMVWSTFDPEIEWEGELLGEPFGNADFVREIEERLDTEANEDHSQAFVVCQTMAQAIEAVGSTDNTEIRDWLASRTADDPVRTTQGDYYWDDIGLTADRDVLLLQWQDGELRFVYPRGDEYSTAVDLQWPKPEW